MKPTRIQRLTIALLTVSMAIGCTSMLRSRPVETITPDDAQGSLVYALPKTLVKLSIADCANPDLTTADVTLTPTISADPRHVYVLDYTPNPLSRDDLTVGVVSRETPILANLNAVAEDKTTEALREAAWSAARASWLARQTKSGAIPVDIDFDPHDPRQMEAVRAALSQCRLDIRCAPSCASSSERVTEESNGLFMRAAIPVQLALCHRSCDTYLPSRIESIPSYNGSPIYNFPVRRSGFVTRTTQLRYQGGPALGTGAGTQASRSGATPEGADNPTAGALVEVVIDKPSEALEVAKAPGIIIGAIIGGLTGKLSDGTTDTQTRDDLLAEEVNLLQAEIDLMDAQLKLWEQEDALGEQ